MFCMQNQVLQAVRDAHTIRHCGASVQREGRNRVGQQAFDTHPQPRGALDFDAPVPRCHVSVDLRYVQHSESYSARIIVTCIHSETKCNIILFLRTVDAYFYCVLHTAEVLRPTAGAAGLVCATGTAQESSAGSAPRPWAAPTPTTACSSTGVATSPTTTPSARGCRRREVSGVRRSFPGRQTLWCWSKAAGTMTPAPSRSRSSARSLATPSALC